MRKTRTPVAQGPLERTAGTEAGVDSEPPVPGVLGRVGLAAGEQGRGWLQVAKKIDLRSNHAPNRKRIDVRFLAYFSLPPQRS